MSHEEQATARSARIDPVRSKNDSNCLVRIDELSAGFESNVVLKEISFDIPRRRVLGIVGPAGVGKSTLLRTLGRRNDPLPSFWVHGHAWYGGHELLRELDAEYVRARIALLAQKARLYTATILENAIAEAPTPQPLRHSQKLELAHRTLAPLGLWEDLRPLLNEEVLSLPLGT